jgi:hypothetical protein
MNFQFVIRRGEDRRPAVFQSGRAERENVPVGVFHFDAEADPSILQHHGHELKIPLELFLVYPGRRAARNVRNIAIPGPGTAGGSATFQGQNTILGDEFGLPDTFQML